MRPLIQVVFTYEDVDAMAAEHDDITWSLAYVRAEKWAKHIEQTLTQLGNEQLASVVRTGQP